MNINKHSEENVYWNNNGGTRDDDRMLTGQKPDLTYGFPTFLLTPRFSPALSDADNVRSFRADMTQRLEDPQWELKASLTTKIYRDNSTEKYDSDLMCFPWAVVEVKRRSIRKDARDLCYR